MKKFAFLLSLVMVLSLVGMNGAQADNWDITVCWEDNNTETCDVGEDVVYKVSIAIYDGCNGGQEPIYTDVVVFDEDPHCYTFNPGQICVENGHEPCYKICVKVGKFCRDQSGNLTTLLAVDDDCDKYNCEDIYNGEILFTLTLN